MLTDQFLKFIPKKEMAIAAESCCVSQVYFSSSYVYDDEVLYVMVETQENKGNANTFPGDFLPFITDEKQERGMI